jgi:DNA-binding GntR family transcriptional regulator
VREALRTLQSDGMVSRIQGAGSRVLRDAPLGAFVQNYRSMSDLTQYAEQTNLEILSTRDVILDQALAGQIGGNMGEGWFCMTGLRRLTEAEPLALVESYVPRRFAAMAPDLARRQGPIYAGLAEAAGEPIQDVEQQTQAMAAPDHVAHALGIAKGAPSLRILRRYSSRSGTLIASFNWHLGGDRYVHRTRIGLEGN